MRPVAIGAPAPGIGLATLALTLRRVAHLDDQAFAESGEGASHLFQARCPVEAEETVDLRRLHVETPASAALMTPCGRMVRYRATLAAASGGSSIDGWPHGSLDGVGISLR